MSGRQSPIVKQPNVNHVPVRRRDGAAGSGCVMMAGATTISAADPEQAVAAKLPLPLMLLMLDVMQARGRQEAVLRLVDELYARGEEAA
jgi:hypothetical protein